VEEREVGSSAPVRSEAAVERGGLERRKRATRVEILRAALASFASEGLYATRIEDITERAGIAKGTFYLYFDDKDALVAAVVARGFDALRSAVEARLVGARTLREEARLVARAHLDFFAGHPDYVRILHQSRGVLKLERARWRRLARSLEEHLARIDGWLASADREARRELSLLLFGCVSGSTSVLVATDPAADVGSRAETWARAIAAAIVEARRPALRTNGRASRRSRER
jgi:AcrR family transcriptional regulator